MTLDDMGQPLTADRLGWIYWNLIAKRIAARVPPEAAATEPAALTHDLPPPAPTLSRPGVVVKFARPVVSGFRK